GLGPHGPAERRARGIGLPRSRSGSEIAARERDKRSTADERKIRGRPREERCAGVMRAAERPEREHELREARRAAGQAVERVLVEGVEREDPPGEARDVLQLRRMDRVPDLAE